MTTTSATPCAPGTLFEAVRRSVAELRQGAPGAEATTWPREEREAAIAVLDGLVTELTVYRGQVLLAHQKAGQWGSVSDRDYADWRSRETGTGRGAAMGDLQLAEGLEQMSSVADAVERGELNLEHAKTLGRLRRGASAEVQHALDDGGLEQLVKRASREKLTAPELGRKARAWAARIDADAAQHEFDAVRRRRSLTMRKEAGGVRGDFFLDPIAGEELRTAFEAITGRPEADDDRTPPQRMADALSTMASRTLQVGSDLTGAQVRPHLALLVTEETWAAIRAHRREREDGECVGVRRLPDVPPAELEDGTPVPLRELERLVCDCELTRVVMNAAGVPLDVGRTQRTYTKELRRAVVTRDRHCQWPACRRRAAWCEVHHLTYFSRGGVTSLAEGITLCTYHHHRVHEHEVRISVLADGFRFDYRDGRSIGTTHRSTLLEPRLPDPDGTRRNACLSPPASQVVGPGQPVIEGRPPPPPAKTAPPEVATSASRRRGAAAGSSVTAPPTLWGKDPPC